MLLTARGGWSGPQAWIQGLFPGVPVPRTRHSLRAESVEGSSWAAGLSGVCQDAIREEGEPL